MYVIQGSFSSASYPDQTCNMTIIVDAQKGILNNSVDCAITHQYKIHISISDQGTVKQENVSTTWIFNIYFYSDWSTLFFILSVTIHIAICTIKMRVITKRSATCLSIFDLGHWVSILITEPNQLRTTHLTHNHLSQNIMDNEIEQSSADGIQMSRPSAPK